MATTIITKNGSGAPAAGDLVQGELAVDLTNKTLYSKDSSGTVIKVGDTGGGSSGTFTDLTATVSLTANGILYPTTDGTDGQAILTDGNGTLAFGDVVGGIDYTTQTSNYTLEANQGVIADTTGGTFVVTLPLSPAEGDQVVVADGGDWSTTNLTVGRNGQTIEGVASDLIMDVGGISVTMVFDGTTWQLYPATGTSAGTTYTLDQTTTAGNVTTNDITVGSITSKGAADCYLTLEAGAANGNDGILFKDTTGTQKGAILYSTNNDYVFVSTANTERMRIDDSGNMGIGTDNPATKLDVIGSSGGGSGIVDTLSLRNTGTSFGDGARIQFTSGTSTVGAAIASSGTALDSADLLFYAGGNTERMRIDSDGALFVGKDTLSYGTDGLHAEQSGAIGGSRSDGPTVVWNRNNSNGDVVLYRRNNLTVGSVYCTTTATTYGTSSDVRLKRNIIDAPAGNIDDIKIRSFAWKIDGSQQKYGVVAQELFEVAPEAVTKGDAEEDTWGVDYSKLVPMMIKEIQDLKAEVAALKGVN